MRIFFRLMAFVVLAALLAAGWDFAGFARRAEAMRTVPVPETGQAVAALTGASDARIITSVRLAEKLQLPLLISGVHVDTSPADIARIVGVSEESIACCVTLGRTAASTEGNGVEVADWARRHNLTDVIVVTSDYHMQRAMVELRHAMPEGRFAPYPVISTSMRPGDWYRNSSAAQRLLSEWMKYRIASWRADGAAAKAQRRDAPQ